MKICEGVAPKCDDLMWNDPCVLIAMAGLGGAVSRAN